MISMQEIAIKGAAAQGKIDKYLTLAYKAALENSRITELGINAGMVKPIRGKIMLAEARAATGAIAAAAHAFAVLHKDQTMACVESGCDVPALSSVGGISVLGGGDR